MSEPSPFLAAYQGGFINMLRWEDYDRLVEALRQHNDGNWYVYAVGEPPPQQPASASEVETFLTEVSRLIREDHGEDYCGIVYADQREQPSFVKFYDPNNLGASCGSSGRHVTPGWIMSRLAPEDLKQAFPLPGNRRRWWKRLFAS
ncbi:MAG: hypothetical protein HUJ29_01575 [Gammaproteobacteria bacterium]|nr:hypothetical protein [Gammaproteobacteria bacterium]